MTKPLFIYSLMMLLSLSTFAQKEDHKWIYNWSNTTNNDTFDWAGASVIDFNVLPPLIYKDSDIFLDFSESNASICDENGDYLYYSNGQEIHGNNHQALINGDTINYGPRWDIFQFTDVNGNASTNGFPGVQEIGFIPQPETDTLLIYYKNDNEYFEIGDDYNWHLLQAKIIEKNGIPKVIEKDIIINDRIRASGATTACKHANGRDWWLLQFNEDIVYNYLITPKGIRLDHQQTLPFKLTRSFLGQSKFSPSGDYFAYQGLFDINSDEGKGLMISKFDRCTGDLVDPMLDLLPIVANLSNGLEFSPDGRLLYTSSSLSISQYDLTASDIYASEVIVAQNNGIFNCGIEVGPSPKTFGQMQLAPDNQIYISLAVQCNDVHIIRHPNVRGIDCEVEQNAIILPTFVMGTISNTNTYRLGPLDGSPCDTLGLDNHPISRYWYEQDSLDFLTAQFWDVSYFRPEQWLWDFGDGMTSTDRHPQHSYADKGIYEVCLTVSNENSSNTSCQTLYLGVSDTEDLEEKINLSIYPNPTEGLTRLVLADYLPEQGVVSFYDITGSKVLSQRIQVGANVIDMSGLDLGTYVYEVRDGEKLIGGGKVVRL